jgi:Arc/MetJ-type ribon-helix-helix transcriptional regulator
MQVSLTSASDKIIEQLMALGYSDPASLIEAALVRMAHEELTEAEESPEDIEWMRREIAIGAEQLDRGEFSPLSPSEIKAEVLAEYQQRHSNV